MSRLSTFLQRWLPLLSLVAVVVWVACTLIAPRDQTAFHLQDFGRLPILADGRLKPLDTLARSTLLQLQARQDVYLKDNPVPLQPEEWLLDMFYRQDKADTYDVFVVDTSDTDLLTLLGLTPESIKIHYPDMVRQTFAVMDMMPAARRRFSYHEIAPHLAEIDRQAKLADPVDAHTRTQFQNDVVQLRDRLLLYRSVQHAVQVPGAEDFLGELLRFQDAIPAGVAAVRAKEAGKPHDEDEAQSMMMLGERYLDLSQATNILAIPPPSGDSNVNHWRNAGQALLETFQAGRVDPAVLAYAGLGYAWRNNRPEQFNEILRLYRQESFKEFGPRLKKTNAEVRFNQAEPFYTALLLFVVAGLAGVLSWLGWFEPLRRSAHRLMAVAWVLTTAGILTRMWLEGRPPVTNLYSSALFIGWGSVGLCLILESVFCNAIGVVAGGAIGFGTMFIAQHLALSGDTLEMMRAVLDNNMWLATHVVVVTTGYASTFLAGFLGLIYIIRGVLTPSLDKDTADSLGRMVYGIVCFATLFSFVGTVLGGIWADQSWGRFWGWDPKENGALIIVLWNALILHARWGGMVRQRGLMCLAVFGNIVTGWSWFGTNMLGVGLHSYGFTSAAFYSLSIFVATQLLFIAIGLIPLERWRSYPSLKASRHEPARSLPSDRPTSEPVR